MKEKNLKRSMDIQRIRILCLECGEQAYIGIPNGDPIPQFDCGYCDSPVVKIEESMVGFVPPVELSKRN